MSRAVAILGTGSDVGKSLIAAGICRLLNRAGVKVAPFKAQNMSLNSFVTPGGGEMGRAQVLQAQACGLVPHVDMNPVLLKPEADATSQVIVHGKVWRSQEAGEYFVRQSPLFEVVKESYERLSKQYEVIVIEGAGSAAEMNLRDRDIVNWPVVEMADAVVVLVADIDRGGVFAQVIGTMDLLSPGERQRVIGVVINKFRGDLTLFEEGIRILEQKTGVPVLGVVPFLRDPELDQEDSVDIEAGRRKPVEPESINIAVVLLPHMSNFTDFNQLKAEPDVTVWYAGSPKDLHGADVVILPGSKTTIPDLQYLRNAGFEHAFLRHVQQGKEMVGVCGGFQMLGKKISDPHQVESGGSTDGLGLLDVETEMAPQKTTVQVQAHPLHVGTGFKGLVEGYEIHMGVTSSAPEVLPCFRIVSQNEEYPSQQVARSKNDCGMMERMEGAMSCDGCIWGTYIHGVFDQPGFRRQWLNRVRDRKGYPPLNREISEAVSRRLSGALDRWTDHLKRHLDSNPIFSALELRGFAPQHHRNLP